MTEELNYEEKKILEVMFTNMENIMSNCGDDLSIDGKYFTKNDLFNLGVKIGLYQD